MNSFPLNFDFGFLLIVPQYPKSSAMKRDYGRHNEPPPRRGRPAPEYGSRIPQDRRASSYRDDYSSSRGSGGYSEPARIVPRGAPRRPYVDDGYGQRFERPPPSYREGRARDYDSLSGSKRPYAAMVSKYIYICFLFFFPAKDIFVFYFFSCFSYLCV